MYSPSELELVGAIIGDGHIHAKPPKYYFGLTGNKVTDREYFAKLSALISSVWNKNARVFESSGGLRIRVYSKKIVHKLINDFSTPFNAGKCYSVKIPGVFLKDYSKSKHIIRGIADTDGSVFVSDKPGAMDYPSLEITTVSKELAENIWEILIKNGFRVARIRKSRSRLSKSDAYKVCLYGKANLKKWIEEIGFSNPHKYLKAVSFL